MSTKTTKDNYFRLATSLLWSSRNVQEERCVTNLLQLLSVTLIFSALALYTLKRTSSQENCRRFVNKCAKIIMITYLRPHTKCLNNKFSKNFATQPLNVKTWPLT